MSSKLITYTIHSNTITMDTESRQEKEEPEKEPKKKPEKKSKKEPEKNLGNVAEKDSGKGKEVVSEPVRPGNEVILYRISHAAPENVDAIAAVESECFPVSEAASREEFAERVKYYGDHFWLLWDKNQLIGFVDGFVTDAPDLTDEMYEKASLHNEDGAWQMIFGVNTIPEYRCRGCANRLLKAAVHQARHEGRKGIVLTCKDKLIHYYEGIGFTLEGESQSVHGNAKWYQMRMSFTEKKPVFMDME